MIRIETEIQCSKDGNVTISHRSFFVKPPESEALGRAESGLAIAMQQSVDAMVEELQAGAKEPSKIIRP